MFGKWNVRVVECSGCSLFGMRVVWDVGCLGYGLLRAWHFGDVACCGCGVLGMWDEGDVRCLPECWFAKCRTFWPCFISVYYQKNNLWFLVSLHYSISKLIWWIDTLFGIRNYKHFINSDKILVANNRLGKWLLIGAIVVSWNTAKTK